MGHSDDSYPLPPLFKAITEINLGRHGIVLPVIEAE
jgi:hypothetical protein